MVTSISINEKYKQLREQKHHGTNRLQHCINVVNKAIELYGKPDEDIIKAALLHDFFFDDQVDKIKQHPPMAIKNAREQHFTVNEEVEHMVLSHMWPVAGPMPKTYKAWCLNVADKIASINEILDLTLWK